ncbi:DUF1120 domain-containing protein [Serratia fonticola]|uniref:DUF1120 domain-containing protein n=1 Tax=Serratia fonticola TaxID=47917 RepID=UPI001644AA56|nr:DUF1120 domain-containing protein [Serratia fonticola]MBC3232067.1 DUF1120 domain-containing protein [Serratia fonticola]
MKKPLIAATTLTSLLLTMAQAQAQAAAPTAELKVTGTLTVPSCEIAAADDGVYDLGKLSATLVKPAATTTLNPISKTWTITCDADTYLNFSPVDNRAASSAAVATTNFGMGMVNGTGKIGYYTAQMRNATVDGKTSGLFTSASPTFTAYTTASITTGQRSGWANSTGNQQQSGKVFAAEIVVTPELASLTSMNGAITDDANIDGSMTLNFAFGI